MGRDRRTPERRRKKDKLKEKKPSLVSSRFNYFAGLLVHGCDIQRVYIYIHIYVYLYMATDK